ncbi:prolipoprotein diacylglyceryl transferase [Nocardioides terrisoli]|uniref:prolipoprotein diacylglyceryl transferase n=1 Tax=Nocardioides terrisoli TaxID=3388267 RepID=UPI00287BA0D7|nr:prolipoprotein diacylglyceryl transferase [Nocardioides marmorisolisilvae]
MTALLIPGFIPSPSQGVWHLGPLPVRGYALCIIAGVIAAVWLGERRWEQRGGTRGEIADIALWAVPFGLVGARVYHVITDHELYFPSHPIGALEVWNGGLAIWGAIAGGVLGGAIACRRRGIRMRPLMDALAPGLLLAQAIGRWGNYFNQELYGKPTTLPWGLKIDSSHWVPPYTADNPPPTAHGLQYATFHPTFLYECVWNLGAFGLVLWLDRRLRLGFGRCFALYVACYCAGRFWIENLRIDVAADGDHFLGMRFNAWVALVLFVCGLVAFVVIGRRHPRPGSREESPYVDGHRPADSTDPADSTRSSAPREDEDVAEPPDPSTPTGSAGAQHPG